MWEGLFDDAVFILENSFLDIYSGNKRENMWD